MSRLPSRLMGIAVCTTHISCMLLYNVHALFPAATHAAGKLCHIPAVRAYGEFTGLGTTYGFFAPQVASMFILQLSQQTAAGTINWTSPALHTPAARTRYVAFLNYCQFLLPDTTGSYAAQRKQAVQAIHRIARHEVPPTGSDSTRCSVYAVRHVPLGTPRRAATPRLELMYDVYLYAEIN